jgi:uncharacterized coiled-coil protein SlyX
VGADVARLAAVTAVSDTTEARIAALELQRIECHKVTNAMADAILNVRFEAQQQSASFQALTASGLDLRQQLATARAELASGVNGAHDAAQTAAVAQMAMSV